MDRCHQEDRASDLSIRFTVYCLLLRLVSDIVVLMDADIPAIVVMLL